MISDDLRDRAPDRRVLVGIGVAVLLVVIMIAVILTWQNVKASSADFEHDCQKLGGKVRELGDDTLCMIDDRVIGRR